MGNENQKLPGLQAGRALAALAVAYYHSYMLFNGWGQDYVFPFPGLKEHGYLGVNFFFAISGYVIASVCSKPGFSPREFVIKRFFRLYPIYWAVICFVIAVNLFGVRMPGVDYSAGYMAYSMSLLPQSVAPFYPVTWSLEYELVFYVLAVLIVPLFGVWGLAAVLFGLVQWGLRSPPDFFTCHLVATLNADFLAGVMAFLLRKPLSYIPASILVLAGLFGYYAVAIMQISFSGSVGGFLLVAGLVNANWGWHRAPLAWLVKIGDASYSLYLNHFILLWVPARVFSLLSLTPPPLIAEPLRAAFLASCVWIALWMWRKIEKPSIAYSNQIARQSKSATSKQTADSAAVG